MNRIVTLARRFPIILVSLIIMGVLFITSVCIALFQAHIMGAR